MKIESEEKGKTSKILSFGFQIIGKMLFYENTSLEDKCLRIKLEYLGNI